MSSRLLILAVLLSPSLLLSCARPPEQRAFEVCRAEVGRRLVDPTSALYRPIRVERRYSDGASVVDGWDVHVEVEARAADRRTARSSVRCTLGMDFELLDLAGEQHTEG